MLFLFFFSSCNRNSSTCAKCISSFYSNIAFEGDQLANRPDMCVCLCLCVVFNREKKREKEREREEKREKQRIMDHESFRHT